MTAPIQAVKDPAVQAILQALQNKVRLLERASIKRTQSGASIATVQYYYQLDQPDAPSEFALWFKPSNPARVYGTVMDVSGTWEWKQWLKGDSS